MERSATMKNIVEVLVVLVGVTLAPSLAFASGAQPELGSQTQTASFVVLRGFQGQSVDYEKLQAIAAQAFGRLSPGTRKWLADISQQHPAGSFSPVWAIKSLQEKFSAADLKKFGELLLVIMAYQHVLNKESRQDRTFSSGNKQAELSDKQAKRDADTRIIDQSKKEANERASHAMDAADAQMWTGVIGGLCQMVGGIVGISSVPASSWQPGPAPDKKLQAAAMQRLQEQSAALLSYKL
jgi:hypothetical protein